MLYWWIYQLSLLKVRYITFTFNTLSNKPISWYFVVFHGISTHFIFFIGAGQTLVERVWMCFSLIEIAFFENWHFLRVIWMRTTCYCILYVNTSQETCLFFCLLCSCNIPKPKNNNLNCDVKNAFIRIWLLFSCVTLSGALTFLIHRLANISNIFFKSSLPIELDTERFFIITVFMPNSLTCTLTLSLIATKILHLAELLFQRLYLIAYSKDSTSMAYQHHFIWRINLLRKY